MGILRPAALKVNVLKLLESHPLDIRLDHKTFKILS